MHDALLVRRAERVPELEHQLAGRRVGQGAAALDDTAGEGRAAVVLLCIELEPQDSFDEPIAGIGLDPTSPKRLGDHPVGANQ